MCLAGKTKYMGREFSPLATQPCLHLNVLLALYLYAWLYMYLGFASVPTLAHGKRTAHMLSSCAKPAFQGSA